MKIKNQRISKLILFIFSLSSHAWADILFIDTNNSENEYKAALAAATARGERLIAVPPGETPLSSNSSWLPRTKEQSDQLREIKALQTSIDKLFAPSTDLWRKKEAINAKLIHAQNALNKTPGDSSLQATIDQQKKDLNDTLNQMGNKVSEIQNSDQYKVMHEKLHDLTSKFRINFNDKIEKILDSYEHQDPSKPERKITSFISSGHYGYEQFWGVLGTLDVDFLKGTLDRHPTVRDQIKSAYGLGCYSNTPDRCLWWQATFKGAKLVGGFDAGAPGDKSIADADFLQFML